MASRRIALLYPGDRAMRDRADPAESRVAPLFAAIDAAGMRAEPAVWHDDFADEVRAQLRRVDVVLEHDAGVAQLRVTDSGIGIADADRDHVFRRFYRSPEAVQLAIPGSGLGLALCSAITARHHGTIALDPAGGRGTTVVVRLPVG